ncbi:MAG: S-adenosylmethionine decarboxylase, partial [Patescibacteria group bacterium]
HVIVDIENANTNIQNKEKVKGFLVRMAAAVDMCILCGPYVASGHPDNPGLTGFAVVDFSHISVHTFTKCNEALIDVFSCKPYDQEKMIALCMATFGGDAALQKKQIVSWG